MVFVGVLMSVMLSFVVSLLLSDVLGCPRIGRAAAANVYAGVVRYDDSVVVVVGVYVLYRW